MPRFFRPAAAALFALLSLAAGPAAAADDALAKLAADLGTPVRAYEKEVVRDRQLMVEYLPSDQQLDGWTRMATFIVNASYGTPEAMSQHVAALGGHLRGVYEKQGAAISAWEFLIRNTDKAAVVYGEFRVGEGPAREDSAVIIVPVAKGRVLTTILAARGRDLTAEDKQKLRRFLSLQVEP